MDPTITASVIGGACTVVAPVVTYMITRRIDNINKLRISRDRRAALNAEWRGRVYQDRGPDGEPLEFLVNATFKTTTKTITGSSVIRVPRPDNEEIEEVKLTFEGGFLYDRWLRLNYVASDRRQVQFGSTVLLLDSQAKTLKGHFVGYGAITDAIVTGSMKLERVKSD
jgi:hypothetical protein